MLGLRFKLGACLGTDGRIDESIELLEQLLDNNERVLGPDHAETLKTRERLQVTKEVAPG